MTEQKHNLLEMIAAGGYEFCKSENTLSATTEDGLTSLKALAQVGIWLVPRVTITFSRGEGFEASLLFSLV